MLKSKKNEPPLPVNWVKVPLGEIISMEYGKGLTKNKRDATGSVPVYGSNGLIGYHTVPLTKNKCLVIGRKGAIGAVHLSPVPCWPIDTTYFIEVLDKLNLNFFYYFFSFINLKQLDKSTAIPGLNRNDVYSINISLPPFSEQHRIVAKIEELFSRLDAGIEELQRIKAQLKRYRQAVLKYAFEGKLTKEWREKRSSKLESAMSLRDKIMKLRAKKRGRRQQSYSESNCDELPSLPNSWTWVRLGEIVDIVSGKTPKGINQYGEKGDVPFYKVGDMNIRGNETYMKKSRIMLGTKDIAKLRLRIQDAGTIIFPKRGGAIKTNKKRILSTPSCYGLNIMGIFPYIISTKLLFLWLSTLELNRFSDGSNVPQINHDDIALLNFPLAPLEEQIQIVSEIERLCSNFDAIGNAVNICLYKSNQLRQSILKKAIEGKLVSQNPKDEPAENLLERIKKEKENHGKEKKTRNGRKFKRKKRSK